MKNYYPKWLIAEMVKQINREVFGGVLPLESLRIKQTRKPSEFCALYWDCEIELFTFQNPDTFELFNTIAHEMIHFYQDCLELPMNHGGAFFRYYSAKCKALYDVNEKTFKGY